MRLLGSAWFTEQSMCPLDTKEINSAVVCVSGLSYPKKTHALTMLESILGIHEVGVAGEAGVPAFL